jgi:hypothetical protein
MNEARRMQATRISKAGRWTATAVAMLALAACQSAEPPRQTVAAEATAPILAAPPEATQPARPPIPAAQATFRFEQILGVPTNKQDILAGEIARAAKGRNLTLVRRTDPSASYRVLGFLSAVGGDAGVTITYVWDIVDAQNKRIHRITGIEIGGSSDADPWAGVDSDILSNVAARTVEQIYAWVNEVPPTSAPPLPAAAAPMQGEAI